MARSKLLSTLVMLPISKIYGLVVAVRNALFDYNIIHQYEPDIPVVVVGNISVGGAGKTPHTEYLVEQLMKHYKIAILSRGYKRKTHGFVLATPASKPTDIGDEPYQMYHKLGKKGVMVAVCENRTRGIQTIRQLDPKVNLIVMDDAFQHRYVKPTVAIVLTEYGRPAFHDSLLPYGRLREPVGALNRADMVVVTKCPDDMKAVEYSIFASDMKLFPYQKLLFSRYDYKPLVPLFPDEAVSTPSFGLMSSRDTLVAVVGVANPRPLLRYMRSTGAKVKVCRFPDHHQFDRHDLQSVLAKFRSIKSARRYIITTEKDAVRLRDCPYFPAELRPYIFYVPITVEFMGPSQPSLADQVRKLLVDHERHKIK